MDVDTLADWIIMLSEEPEDVKRARLWRAWLLRACEQLGIEEEKVPCPGDVLVELFIWVVGLTTRNQRLDAANAALAGTVAAQAREIRELKRNLDRTYGERDRLVGALSKLFPSSLERHGGSEPWDDAWRWVVYISLPTGQVSWHIHDRELPWFDHLWRNLGTLWDGHTTKEKYARLEKLPMGILPTSGQCWPPDGVDGASEHRRG